MSCQACMRLPKDAYARFVTKVRTFKTIQQSMVRVVYADATPFDLRIDGAKAPRRRDETGYFMLESGDKILSLVNRNDDEIVAAVFEFKPDVHYTIVVFDDYILQFEEEDISCPIPGYVRLQAYNMDNGTIDVYLDENMIFEGLENDQFMETIIPADLYDLRVSNRDEFFAEIELKTGNIYTLFFVEDVIIIVENENCED